MTSNDYYYRPVQYPNDKYPLKIERDGFVEDPTWHAVILADAGQDYYDNRDGWEDSWPMKFEVIDEDGNKLFSGDVSVEFEPCFDASVDEL